MRWSSEMWPPRSILRPDSESTRNSAQNMSQQSLNSIFWYSLTCCSLLFQSSRAQRHTSRKGWVASFSALTWRLPRIPTRIGGTHFQVVHPVYVECRRGMMAPSFVFLSFLLVLGLAAYLLQNFMDNTVVKPQKMDEICRSNSVLYITLGCTTT